MPIVNLSYHRIVANEKDGDTTAGTRMPCGGLMFRPATVRAVTGSRKTVA